MKEKHYAFAHRRTIFIFAKQQNKKMMYKNINEIWKEAFNSRNSQYYLKDVILDDAFSCVYSLEDNREIRISTDTRVYHFSKYLMNQKLQHTAIIYDCFKTVLPNQYGDNENVFCIVSEGLNRNFQSRDVIQSAINLFRHTWSEYLKSIRQLENNPDVCIEQAYADRDFVGENLVLNNIKSAEANQAVIDIAVVLHKIYKDIKELDSNSMLYLFPDNIGISKDNIIKMCNISHDYFGLDDNYEIELSNDSVTITYNPIDSEDSVKDYRMLISLNVDYGNGNICPVLAQIDTGAVDSGFVDSFFSRASLVNLGETIVRGVTGKMKSTKTECLVRFPNGHETVLKGSTMKDIGDVSILIGMDLLSTCKFSSEPYENGFRYKLTFL